MNRRHCPQSFDCLKMGATFRRKCPNFKFCEQARSLGGNQELPYEVREDDKGNKYLAVRPFYGEEKEKFKHFGWAYADAIPYQLFKFDGCPVLRVCTTNKEKHEHGWARADDLPWDCLEWYAGALSQSLSEFRILLKVHESKRFEVWTAEYFYDVWRIEN